MVLTADPRWLVYLPPTMAPATTTATTTTAPEGLLEHPAEAFASFRRDGVSRLVCEEKHMGSRAVVVVCRDGSTTPFPGGGTVLTRTGRPFFADPVQEDRFLGKVRAGVDAVGLWEELSTDWLVLDCELLPWSANAQDLFRHHDAAVGPAAAARDVDVGARAEARRDDARRFIELYRRYCWPVASIDDLKLAPFQILAGEGTVHARREHTWHLDVLARLVAVDPTTFRATRNVVVDLGDLATETAAVRWWEELTDAGGEGMVVKPLGVVATDSEGRLVQPGIKCRGREFLRSVYGPDYTAPANLERLRSRSVAHKRSLAVREFALGLEALERFVAGEPMYRVHECVFGVLALESDPRL
jgi:protein phosphatase